jgi:hypothetical protein
LWRKAASARPVGGLWASPAAKSDMRHCDAATLRHCDNWRGRLLSGGGICRNCRNCRKGVRLKTEKARGAIAAHARLWRPISRRKEAWRVIRLGGAEGSISTSARLRQLRLLRHLRQLDRKTKRPGAAAISTEDPSKRGLARWVRTAIRRMFAGLKKFQPLRPKPQRADLPMARR